MDVGLFWVAEQNAGLFWVSIGLSCVKIWLFWVNAGLLGLDVGLFWVNAGRTRRDAAPNRRLDVSCVSLSPFV